MTPMASRSAVTVSSSVVRAAAASWPTMMPSISARLDPGVSKVRLRFGSGIFHPPVQPLHSAVPEVRHGDLGHVGAGLTVTGRRFLWFPVTAGAAARRAHDRLLEPVVMKVICIICGL